MMKQLLYCYLIVILCSCSTGTSVKKNDITKSWRLSEVLSIETENPEMEGMMKKIAEKQLVSKGYLLSFFPDNTYTELTGYHIEEGEWQLINDHEIKFGEKKLRIKKIEKRKSKNFMIAEVDSKGVELNMNLLWVEEAPMLKEYKEDPFYGENNKWRTKPKNKETDEQIRNRLLNYILHFAYILQSSTQRDQSVVSFTNSMGIIRVYRGGIGRVRSANIPKDWTNCFYDQEDATKAYELFSQYLTRGVYKGGTTGSWVKDDYKILMTIYDEIKMKGKG